MSMKSKLIAVNGLIIFCLAYTLSPPDIIVNNFGLDPIPGSYFIGTNIRGSSDVNYRIIADNNGDYSYISSVLPIGEIAHDFKRHEYGVISHRAGDCIGIFDGVTLDKIDEFCASGDYEGERVDVHDFLFDAQGDAWLMIYRNEPVDLSAFGGPISGTMEMSIIQEIDNVTRNVKWQIRADEWLSLDDATVALTSSVKVYPNHINSYDLCDDETAILISTRNVDEVVKIRLEDKEIIWRMGGKNTTTIPSDGIENYKQHDARCVDDKNLISIFDNGDKDLRPYSRAVVYDVGEITATLIYEYKYNLFAPFTGNFQYKPDINRGLIHWGGAAYTNPNSPNVTEVRLSDNSIVQELFLPDDMISYRITKHFYGNNFVYLPLVNR